MRVYVDFFEGFYVWCSCAVGGSQANRGGRFPMFGNSVLFCSFLALAQVF